MFQKATKKKAKARVALIGPSGSGKTYTALLLAKHLGKRIAVIDTERGSASKYSGDVADFDVCELPNFAPAKYVEALRFAANEGYDVVIVDSLTHAWTGEGGLLDQKDKYSGKSSFDAWRTLTPQHNQLVETILGYPGHLIATMRVKTEYVIEQDERTGKKVPRKVGLAPVQRDGLEYEFDVVADMDPDNCLHVSKSRCPALAGAAIRKPGADVAKTLLAWLDDGVEAPKTKLPADAILEVLRGGDIDRAKELARKAWKVLSAQERERVKLSIEDTERERDNDEAERRAMGEVSAEEEKAMEAAQ